MGIEIELRNLIITRYKSLRAFSEKTGIPYSTIDSMLKRGIANSSVGNVIKVCNELNINMDALAEGRIKEVGEAPALVGAAAHLDINNPEAIEEYNKLIEYFTFKYGKKD